VATKLEAKLEINADASQARTEIGRLEDSFSKTLRDLGKSKGEIAEFRKLGRNAEENANEIEQLDGELRGLVTTYSRLRREAADRDMLGIGRINKAEKEIERLRQAYERLKKSGTASKRDLAIASRTLEARLEALNADMNKTRRSAGGMASAFGNLRGILAGIGASIGLGQIIQTNREFDKLRASLVTVTGSAKDAEGAFAAIQDYASRTPFSVQEVTQAFIKLKSLGLEPSEEALTSYGNTAAGLGKTLDQMIEAVADAATGEFERLKEFGIRASKAGDQVTFTFKGVSTTVQNTAADVQKYLLQIGNVDFAGGLERQAATLDGSISNLGDAWDRFQDGLLNDKGSRSVQLALGGIAKTLDFIGNDAVAGFRVAVIKAFSTLESYAANVSYNIQRNWLSVSRLWSDTAAADMQRLGQEYQRSAAIRQQAADDTIDAIIRESEANKQAKASISDFANAGQKELPKGAAAITASLGEVAAALDEIKGKATQSSNKVGSYTGSLLAAYKQIGDAAQSMRAGRDADAAGWLKDAAESVKELQQSGAPAQIIDELVRSIEAVKGKQGIGIKLEPVIDLGQRGTDDFEKNVVDALGQRQIPIGVTAAAGSIEDMKSALDLAMDGYTVNVKIVPDLSAIPSEIRVPVKPAGAGLDRELMKTGGR